MYSRILCERFITILSRQSLRASSHLRVAITHNGDVYNPLFGLFLDSMIIPEKQNISGKMHVQLINGEFGRKHIAFCVLGRPLLQVYRLFCGVEQSYITTLEF